MEKAKTYSTDLVCMECGNIFVGYKKTMEEQRRWAH